MTRSILTLSLLATLLTGPVFAQQATDDAAAAPAADAAAPAGPVFKTAEEAAVDETYGRTEGDWNVICQKTLSGEDPCLMAQLLRDEAGNPVINVEVSRLKVEGGPDAMMIINTPVGTILPEGVSVTIDNGKPAKLPFFYCDGQVCVTRVNLRDADAAAFKRGNLAKVRIVPVTNPNEPVTVNMSLKGFTAAYDALQ